MSESTASPCCAPATGRSTPDSSQERPARTKTSSNHPRHARSQVHIPGGTFDMGDGFDEGYPADGERPVHTVWLPEYDIDATAVTNAQFAAFVKQTGYVTEAEAEGYSAVFQLAVTADPDDILGRAAGAPWWLTVAGADWRHPFGRHSSMADRQNHPVVHVSFDDALAYCDWARHRLPSEAEWEYAARGGLSGARFPWGDELVPGRRWRCNIWQGDFPANNLGEDGYLSTAPVKAFPPNGYGLHNMAGNVWEWCADWFSPTYYAESPAESPTGPTSGTARVMRGGSYLCHSSYCHRYRVAARSSNTPTSTSGNLGFRCGGEQRAV